MDTLIEMTQEIMPFPGFIDRIATLPLCRNNSKLPSYFYRTWGMGGGRSFIEDLKMHALASSIGGLKGGNPFFV